MRVNARISTPAIAKLRTRAVTKDFVVALLAVSALLEERTG